MENIKELVRQKMVENKIDPAVCPKCGKLFIIMLDSEKKMKKFNRLKIRLQHGDDVSCKLHNQVGIVWN
jgi:hypothetical protein